MGIPTLVTNHALLISSYLPSFYMLILILIIVIPLLESVLFESEPDIVISLIEILYICIGFLYISISVYQYISISVYQYIDVGISIGITILVLPYYTPINHIS